MSSEESSQVISKRLEDKIKKNPSFHYNVCASVHWDEGKDGECVFIRNKKALLHYCKINMVQIYDLFRDLPSIYVKMTGSQILELSKKEYISYIDFENQPNFTDEIEFIAA